MFYYQILPNRELPGEVLTYASSQQLQIGRVVSIGIRQKKALGVVVQAINTNVVNSKSYSVKEINNTLPIKFSEVQIKLMRSFWYHTFNMPGIVVQSYLRFLELAGKNLLEKVDTQILIGDYKSKAITTGMPELNLINSYDEIILRIIYIIRNNKYDLEGKKVLIIFPEKKLLERCYEIFQAVEESKELLKNWSLSTFTGSKSKLNTDTIKQVLNSRQSQIIFGTRSSLFLPYRTLSEIFLIEESDPFYLQEQNSLYYDTRELVFLMSHIFGVKTTFFSTSPSVRLHNFYFKENLDNFATLTSSTNKKLPKIALTKQNSRVDNFSLFSDAIEQELNSFDEYIYS